jgi:hypothetical protein
MIRSKNLLAKVNKKVNLTLLIKQVDVMKKKTGFLLMVVSLLLVEVPLETMAASTTESTEMTAIGRKRKGYKQKRGGLFNTGLFRKKNPCGCPNH